MMYMPGGPLRPSRPRPSARGQWFTGSCPGLTCVRGNISKSPPDWGNESACYCGHACALDACFVPPVNGQDWKAAFTQQAVDLVPFIANGTVFGIHFGDELSCSGNAPFAVIEAGTSYFRGALSAALSAAGVPTSKWPFYAINECQTTMGCTPSAVGPVCPACPPGCGDPGGMKTHHGNLSFGGYWPSVPSALDFVSVDAYCGNQTDDRCGTCQGDFPSDPCRWQNGSSASKVVNLTEPEWVRQYVENFMYPKMTVNQKIWVVPGLIAPTAATPRTDFDLDAYDRLSLRKMEGYARWTAEDPRVVGWLPWHWASYDNGQPDVQPFTSGAESMPQTLRFIRSVAPPAL
jgi:hypothetical protein